MESKRLQVGMYSTTDGGLFKLIHYVGYMTKEKFTATYNKVKTSYEPANKVILSPAFFRGDDCVCCGRCCKNFTTTYTQEGKNRIDNCKDEDYAKFGLDPSIKQTFIDKLEQVNININGKEIPFWGSFQKDKSKLVHANYENTNPKKDQFLRCAWTIEIEPGKWVCSIHPMKSITCALPHMNIYHNVKNNVYIRKQQYGRNFLLGCPIEFGEFKYDSYKNWDLYWLKALRDAANDMQINTYLPELLNYLESIDDKLQKGIVPLKPIDLCKLNDDKQIKLF